MWHEVFDIYLLCSVLYAMCPYPFMIYPFRYVACLNPFMSSLKIHVMLQFIHNMGKNRTLCVDSCCILLVMAKSCIHAQNFMWHGQIHCLTFGDCYYWVIFRHYFGMWFNHHKVLDNLTRNASIINSLFGAVVERWPVNPLAIGLSPTRCIFPLLF